MESPPPWVTVHYSSSSLPSIWEIVALPTISTLRSLWHRDLHLLQRQLCGTEPMSGACPWSLQIISIFLKMIALSLTFSPKICLWLVKKLLWLLRISVQILNTFQSKEKPKPNIMGSDVFLNVHSSLNKVMLGVTVPFMIILAPSTLIKWWLILYY